MTRRGRKQTFSTHSDLVMILAVRTGVERFLHGGEENGYRCEAISARGPEVFDHKVLCHSMSRQTTAMVPQLLGLTHIVSVF